MSVAAVSVMEETTARPFAKWAGGKRQLLPELHRRLPERFGRYHEPFVGGGAMLFSRAWAAGATVADTNEELVVAYEQVQKDVEGVIRELRGHTFTTEHYYAVRALDPGTLTPNERAARTIYLNRTCFNGLYRVNRAGRFNVPIGRYANPTICDAANLRACSRHLERTLIFRADFAETMACAEPDDFMFLDPPYVPVSKTSSFTAYGAEGFNETEQRALAECFAHASSRGVHLMLTNSDTPLVRELYADFRIDEVRATRAINSKSSKRGKVSELVVRNYG